jgi:iron complex transport system substrate-binding protein
MAVSVSGTGISTWGKNIIQNEEIAIAGGINVAANDVDGSKVVSNEQILKWNPDIIFVDGSTGQGITDNPTFASLEAVQKRRVYTTPTGVFRWSNLGAETALYLPWMAKTMYPEKLTDVNINDMTKSFYRTFFDYDLSDKELNLILSSLPPS